MTTAHGSDSTGNGLDNAGNSFGCRGKRRNSPGRDRVAHVSLFLLFLSFLNFGTRRNLALRLRLEKSNREPWRQRDRNSQRTVGWRAEQCWLWTLTDDGYNNKHLCRWYFVFRSRLSLRHCSTIVVVLYCTVCPLVLIHLFRFAFIYIWHPFVWWLSFTFLYNSVTH